MDPTSDPTCHPTKDPTLDPTTDIKREYDGNKEKSNVVKEKRKANREGMLDIVVKRI